jgi:hypothetical protein
MFSATPDGDEDRHVKNVATDQRTPIAERFGGWFVTGGGAAPHLGNRVPALEGRPAANLASVEGLFDPDGFRAASSDVAALLAFSHQTHMTNLLTRAAWDARAVDPALHPGAGAATSADAVGLFMRVIAEEVVDYLLFVDEAPLPTPVTGRSAFAERMAARGPRDRRGRSLFELDLTRRLLKYPCSYLVYSPAFDALPPLAKAPIYQRLWQVLSGDAREPRYRVLSREDRQAVVDILKDTKPDLPPYFTNTVR